MGAFHKDDRVDQAIIELNDALCEYERATSREATLLIIPHNSDENVHLSVNGKPTDRIPIAVVLAEAIHARNK